MPLIPLKDTVIFPQSITALYINQTRSKKAISSAMDTNKMVFLSAIKDSENSNQTVYKTGCVALIRHKKETPGGKVKILVQGLSRATINSIEEKSFSTVYLDIYKEVPFVGEVANKSLEELKKQLKELFHSKKFFVF